jgi:hypothetical protein
MSDPETENESLRIAKSRGYTDIVDYLNTLEPEIRMPLIPLETLFI